MLDMETYTHRCKEAQGVEVKSVLPTASQEASGNLAEKEGKEPAGEASGKTGASYRIGVKFVLVTKMKDEYLQRAMGPHEVSPEASTREEECRLEGDLELGSSKEEVTPWNCFHSSYKELPNSTMAKVWG
ncbi:gametogenetin-binding protein 1-like [Callithrix jacchus]